MAFYLRKSIRAGPLRLNLSKSGVGVSAGVRGFRIGSGPRGNYVHVGRGGLYYRRSLGPSRPKPGPRPAAPSPAPALSPEVELKDIDSGSVLDMVDASAADLLAELNDRQARLPLWPWAAVVCAALVGLAAHIQQPPSVVAGGAVGAVAAAFLGAAVDRRRRMVALLYDLEPEAEQAYCRMHEAFDAMNEAQRKWHVEAKGDVRDPKYQAGATSLVRRNEIRFSSEPPTNVKTNVSVPTIPVGRQILCFFPDRLLVFHRRKVGAVPYSELTIKVEPGRFVEEERPPKDAEIVDRTWQYVNKDGGPDRRFTSNPELPVVLYDDIRFRSASGLNEYIQISQVGLAATFAKAVRSLAALEAHNRKVPCPNRNSV